MTNARFIRGFTLLEILLALSYDEQDSMVNFGLLPLAYFSYCQLWILVVGKALYLDVVKRERQTWVKTPRFSRSARAGQDPS